MGLATYTPHVSLPSPLALAFSACLPCPTPNTPATQAAHARRRHIIRAAWKEYDTNRDVIRECEHGLFTVSRLCHECIWEQCESERAAQGCEGELCATMPNEPQLSVYEPPAVKLCRVTRRRSGYLAEKQRAARKRAVLAPKLSAPPRKPLSRTRLMRARTWTIANTRPWQVRYAKRQGRRNNPARVY